MLLKNPSTLDLHVSPPTEGWSLYSYNMRTNYAPGIVCKDDVPSSFQGRNCILMWIDEGVPIGKVLYTYFSISFSNIFWHNQAYVMVFGNAVGNLSAGSFDDKFALAFKDAFNDGYPSYNYNTLGSMTSWGVPSDIDTGQVLVDSPTWSTAGDGHEALLMWTQVPYAY